MMKSRKDQYEAAQQDHTSFGNMLVRSKVITEAQLKAALDFQKTHGDTKLGEVCVFLGFTSQKALDAVVARQKILRSPESERASVIDNLAKTATSTTDKLHATLDKFNALTREWEEERTRRAMDKDSTT